MRNQVVAGRSVATTGCSLAAARARASTPAGHGEAGEQPEGPGRLEDPPGLVGGEDAGLAEDVGEAGPALGRHPGELLVDAVANVRLGTLRARPVFRRDRGG